MSLANTPFTLRVQRVRPHDLPAPARAHETDAGLDLPLDLSGLTDSVAFDALTDGYRRAVTPRHNPDVKYRELLLGPGARVNLPTGWAIELPPGWEAQVRGRSGLAFNKGVVIGHVGTVDAGFRGEIRVCLVNASGDVVTLKHGDRIAQLVIAQVPAKLVTIEVPGALSATPRGANGYGSTGT